MSAVLRAAPIGSYTIELFQNYDTMIWSATSMESLESKILHFEVATNPNYKIVACFDATTMLKIDVPGHGALGVSTVSCLI